MSKDDLDKGFVLEIRGLKKYYPLKKGIFIRSGTRWVKAVDKIDFSINNKGETFGLVGESGCGKTTTAKIILRLERPTEGSILFQSKNIAHLSGSELKRYRTSVQAVFQDPYSSLSPRMKVGSIIAEPLVVNNFLPTKTAIKSRVEELLKEVKLDPRSVHLYPHEFSGGQRQRIAIARALALNPCLIILDEPVSALDVSIRAQIMNLFKELQGKLGLAYVLIAHNLATVRYMSHRMGVMYLGKIVESGESEGIYSQPLHPYTKALLSAALPFRPNVKIDDIILTGEVPSALDPPPGCRFHPRCGYAMPLCCEVEPSLRLISNDHLVSCHLYQS
jgi:oligopeptide/dipeptide ABC transporter ATP-binding protein